MASSVQGVNLGTRIFPWTISESISAKSWVTLAANWITRLLLSLFFSFFYFFYSFFKYQNMCFAFLFLVLFLFFQEKLLHETKFNFRFVNPSFEKEFRWKAIKSAHNYTLILSHLHYYGKHIPFQRNCLCRVTLIHLFVSLHSLCHIGIIFILYIIFIWFFDYGTFISAVPVATFVHVQFSFNILIIIIFVNICY